MTKEEWEHMKMLAELILKVAKNDGWSDTDLVVVLAKLALKAYSMGVQEWTPPKQ